MVGGVLAGLADVERRGQLVHGGGSMGAVSHDARYISRSLPSIRVIYRHSHICPSSSQKLTGKKRFLFEFELHALMAKGSCREPLGGVLMGVLVEILSDRPLCLIC